MTTSNTEATGLSAIREVIETVQKAHASRRAGTRPSARSEILAHAIDVFAARGLERTTVQHLLDAASVSRRTFYKYFRSKYDVLESVYEVCVAHIILRFRQEAERAVSVDSLLQRTIGIYFDYHVSLGPIIRLMLEEARRGGSVLWPHRERAYVTAVGVLQTEMERMSGRRHSQLVFRALIWSLESYSLHLLNDTACSPADLEQSKRVMSGVAEALLVHGTSPWLFDASAAGTVPQSDALTSG